MPVDLATINPPAALSPLDGRYRDAVAPLRNFLSEAALNRARVHVEVEWLIHLTQNRVVPGVEPLNPSQVSYLRNIPEQFGAEDVAELAQLEAQTRHDVKAVEYYLQQRLAGAPGDLSHLKALVHIYCTSEDINNLAYALTITAAVREVWAPAAQQVRDQLARMAQEYAEIPMLARTHGQPATPVTLGKELAVFAARLDRQLQLVRAVAGLGKFNGATGDYAAHLVSVPEADWEGISRSFVEGLGLQWNPLTTQIESHDWQAELFHALVRAQRVLHNLATDVWEYISLGYFTQQLSAHGSTGSSTMPHKINPIRFENAEANLEISCGVLETLAATLQTSRLQRDLTDSTTERNVGVGLGHGLLALGNLQQGLQGLGVDAAAMARDLEENWEVLGEAVQSVMRTAALGGVGGLDDPYERVKELTRGHRVTAQGMRSFVEGLGLPEAETARLLALTPQTYVGLAPKLVRHLR